ncbi:hypothetical protein AAG906_035693 [Vitis piasezkii]
MGPVGGFDNSPLHLTVEKLNGKNYREWGFLPARLDNHLRPMKHIPMLRMLPKSLNSRHGSEAGFSVVGHCPPFERSSLRCNERKVEEE